jgi:hypothetical protein
VKAQCAWCAKPLPDKPPLDDPRVSHGICDDCCEQQHAACAEDELQDAYEGGE